MAEWWTYRLSDFLLFSPRTYWRLVELYNQAVWPGHLLAVAAGGAIVALLFVRRDFLHRDFLHRDWAGRAICAILALAWAWVGWAWLLERYDTINWAARWFAAGFGVQAALLLGAGAIAGRVGFRIGPEPRSRIGLGLIGAALLAMPFVAPLGGRPWTQIEVFAAMPDPTAVATLGALTLAHGRAAWLLWPVPLAWCAVGGATLWTMGAAEAFLMPTAGMVAILSTVVARRRPLPQPPPARGGG
ncbi:MAG: DUF6064 family protein [Rhodospirillales bacterium]